MRPRKSRAGTGAQGRRYKTRAHGRKNQNSRRAPPRQRQQQETPVRSRRTVRRVSRPIERGESFDRSRDRGNKMPVGHRNRRNSMHSQRQPQIGLPSSLLPTRYPNENASNNKTTRSVCTRKKAARRHMIIATGYGGKNGFTDYKEDKSCR